MPHDGRCEAAWNDGVCACEERAEDAALPRSYGPRPGESILRQLLTIRRSRK